MSSEAPNTKDQFHEWANRVFAHSPFDAKIGHLMGLVAALVSGHDGAVSYFYFSAKQAGATETELAGAADIAAAASGLNIYSTMPKE